MSLFNRNIVLRAAMLLTLSLSLLACHDDSDTSDTPFVENSIDGSEGIGIKEFEVKFPAIAKLMVVSQSECIILEMQGVSDMQTYNIYANIDYANDIITISSTGDELATLPHQEYFLNFIKFPGENNEVKSAFDDDRSVTLGAKVSVSDPNNISVTSSYNEDMGCFGDGTEHDPISVVTVACLEDYIMDELTASSTASNLLGVHFQQTRAINFALEYELFSDWTAMGKFNINGINAAFCGVYNGGRNSIEDLSVTSGSSTALFHELGDGAVIKNVKMTNVQIVGGNCTGAIACISSGDVTIENTDVYGSIKCSNTTTSSIGGMIGSGSANFKDCFSNIDISNESDESVTYDDYYTCSMGGFIGRATNSDISFDACCYSGDITCNNSITHNSGGFIGSASGNSYGGEITTLSFINCAVSGSVTKDSDVSSLYSGGVIGYLNGYMNILFDNVVVGATLNMVTDDDDSESIFGSDTPEFSPSTMDIRSSMYSAGGYVGTMIAVNQVVICGSMSSISEGSSINAPAFAGGLFGYCYMDNCYILNDIIINGDVFITDYEVYSDQTSYLISNSTYAGGFIGSLNTKNLTCNSNAHIYCDPGQLSQNDQTTCTITVLDEKREITGYTGTFVGTYEQSNSGSVLNNLYFMNYYDAGLDFVGYGDLSSYDESASTFLNYFDL